MVGDIDVTNLLSLIPSWGLERTVEYWSTFAETIQPIWADTQGPFLVQMAQGEYDAFPFANLHSRMDTTPGFGRIFLEPVPVRLNHMHCVFEDGISQNPHAALLFMEWLASDEAQSSLETEQEPFQSHFSADVPGGIGDELDGLELSINDFEFIPKAGEYSEALIAAAGFPQPVPAPPCPEGDPRC
jgi:hypothetical protein